MPTLSQIHLYPIKSLAGFQVQQWPVDHNGLRYDRKWMLVDETGQFLSQRRLPAMALLKTGITGDSLQVFAPGQSPLQLDLNPAGGEDLAVTIWHDHCLAKTVSAAADEWFSTFLQQPCRLVYHPDDRIRRVDPRYALPSDQTAFSDGFPMLLVSEGSLQTLNQTLTQPIGMNRFRPNLVIADCESFAEDHWRRVRINSIEFRLPKPCSRCSVPGIDPETAISDKEPLAALSRLRTWHNKVYFGQNALHDRSGELAVGQAVEILETGELQPPLPSPH